MIDIQFLFSHPNAFSFSIQNGPILCSLSWWTLPCMAVDTEGGMQRLSGTNQQIFSSSPRIATPFGKFISWFSGDRSPQSWLRSRDPFFSSHLILVMQCDDTTWDKVPANNQLRIVVSSVLPRYSSSVILSHRSLQFQIVFLFFSRVLETPPTTMGLVFTSDKTHIWWILTETPDCWEQRKEENNQAVWKNIYLSIMGGGKQNVDLPHEGFVYDLW